LTWHDVKASHAKRFDLEDYPNMWVDFAAAKYEIWECRGCEDALFLESWLTSEDVDPDEGPQPSESVYPPRDEKHLKPKDYVQLPTALEAIYEEIVRAFNDRCHVLCAIGLRALLEGICDDKGIKSGPDGKGKTTTRIEGKINGLAALAPPTIVKNLHAFRFLGNQAAHELKVPSEKSLAFALEVMEDVLSALYELNYKSSRLLEQIGPPKSPQAAKQPSSAPVTTA
jgi:hypothetical protein